MEGCGAGPGAGPGPGPGSAPRLWKLSDCFSSTPDNKKDYMDGQTPVLELKDVPPPPRHSVPQRFPLAPLPMPPPPCLLPPPPLPLHVDGPNVSACACCRLGAEHFGSRSHKSGDGGVSTLYTAEAPLASASSCSHPLRASPFSGHRNLQVATSQPPASHSHLPCCMGPIRPLHPAPYPRSPHVGHPTLGALHPAPATSSSSSSSSSSGCSYCVRHSEAGTPPHLHPFHLGAEHRVCLKGAHYCQDCFRKPSDALVAEPEKRCPGVPPPLAQSAPIPVPMCNGCGASGAVSDGMLGNSLGKPSLKYGSPDVGAQESLPPVGVFWDIENCSVPSGRSAASVVQRLRTHFFQGHREAEFICVCDINKENKAVIQELNNCQVTVAHINATAKNAADDKLRQSLRRFAETHTAPATVVLVSSDVNFASELSDLRHRHGFLVILVHKNQVSGALLQHAHHHVAFEEFLTDLPPRMPVKSQPGFNLLFVRNLPTHRDAKSVSNRLRRLSDNCGGRVLGISGGTAVLRFGSLEAAERARKRMDHEDVFGCRIRVSFSPDSLKDEEAVGEPEEAAFLPAEKPRSPRRPRRAGALPPARLCQAGRDTVPERPYSPRKGVQPAAAAPGHLQELGMEPKCKMAFMVEKSHPPAEMDTAHQFKARRRDSSGPRSGTDLPVEHFQVSTPSAFSKLCLQRSFSPMLISQGSWSSRGSPSLSNHSSPLNAPSYSPCPDSSEPFSDGADIQVANIDYRMSRKELQQILLDTFSKHGRVKSVELSPHTDYQLKATVQMASLQQAIGAVSCLHRFKIGAKRIRVSLVTGAINKSLTILSTEIVSILQDAPANCLPLFKFTEIYEKKFGHKLVASELYRLPEVVSVREQGGGRLVCLLPSSQARQSPLGSSQSHDSSSTSGSPVVFEELEYHEPVCKRHHGQQNFSEADYDPDSYKVPFVVVSLKTLAAQVHGLLQTHEGTVPLLSFLECYAAEFSPLEVGEEGELPGGVPLEHLITCVPGITVVTAQNGFKVIKWIHNKPPPPNADPWVQRCKSPVGNPQLIQFSREMVDLLKNQPACLMPLSKFIPAYHHHFAKQCRVSDYGYSKLLELLEAVPHVLQILGLGSKRLLTLTHRAQVKRFTQDLLKLLKFQASKQVVIQDFMQAYHWCFSRDWQVVSYGMCDLMDLLSEIPDTTITITHQDEDMVISVPKRERTPQEVERTKQFAKEVVDLLRHQAHFRMPFSKFIPTYHHHFGRQCKLTCYGFTKLVELFEAIPDVLMVLECGEEKVLSLTEVERVKALAAQMVKLLHAQKDASLPMQHLLSEYSKTFGYGLRLQDFDVSSLPALLSKLCHVVKVVDCAEDPNVQLINRKSLRALTSQLLVLLMGQGDARDWLSLEELSGLYEASHGVPLNPCEYGFLSLTELLKSLPYLVELFEGENEEGCCEERARLTRLYQFARSVRALLHTYHYNQIFLTEFPAAFSKYTGRRVQPRTYGYATLDELLTAVPQVVWIKGHGHKKIIVLKNDMKARSSPATVLSPDPEGNLRESSPNSAKSGDQSSGTEAELLCLSSSSPVDLLCAPVPSWLPSPQLHPDPILLQHTDLIRFEEQFPPSTRTETPSPTPAPVAPDVCSSAVLSQEATPTQPFTTAATMVARPGPPHASDCPTKRTPRNRVRLAANFSLSQMPTA
ncbi:meiosis regulator and mRNA stability factor 1 isoform X2 [Denticeps clupeoides]|uniref:meiosis regulator and mRNA stability factor 1 isoform X2 n=1 Tax=Denticeps clupeoides TaxID=299321 RepID=UPI0010A2EA91|nr:meiosis regulator and mRNA stability factor 1 isoform X2 [Denticeps clupeoides]